MADYIPQDEYFEWEDILEFRENEHIAQLKELGCDISTSRYEIPFTPTLSVLQKSEDVPICWDSGLRTENQPSAAVRISISTSASVSPITASEAQMATNPITFPSYDEPSKSDNIEFSVQQCRQIAKDDSEVYLRPSRCVDYFSHEWNVEDMSNSWRHVRVKERSCKNAERLENASWRSWAKLCFGLTTVSPETVNWRKDLDDIYLYGPIHATTIEDSSVLGCDEVTKPILKLPSISELLLQGSQLSWTGRRHSTGGVKSRKSKRRSVKFNHIVEQCFIMEASQKFPKSKGIAYNSVPAVISSAPAVEPADLWNASTNGLSTSIIQPSNDISQWTWLTPSEVAELETELDLVSPTPQVTPTPPTPVLSLSIVRDTIANFQYTPTPHAHTIKLEVGVTDEEDEDEMMASYLFDCEFKSDSDVLSPSESSSSDDDQYDEDVDFLDGDDMADEKRLMHMQEIPSMDTTKQSFYQQVLDEFSIEW